MITLRDYQDKIADWACNTVSHYGIAYLAMEVRTGKTLTALVAAKRYGAKKVLFLTKKRAIQSIEHDYELLDKPFEITVTNYENLHHVTDNDYDLLICDENHLNSAFPKPNNRTKIIKKRFGKIAHIYLSGTPAIESGSQWYHSLWMSDNSPFRNYPNFYRWANDYVNVRMKYLGSRQVRDYTDSKDNLIMAKINHLIYWFTQSEAGFSGSVDEGVLYCRMSDRTNAMLKRLAKDRVIKGATDVILGDTPVKLMSKLHQLESGTVILESEKAIITDTTKAEFIRDKFAGKKIAIFYFFKKELDVIQQVMGDKICTDLATFDTTDKWIALQQVSGSEGISLKAADFIVYYSWGYSGKNYTQSRDRMSTIDRKENNVIFVFQPGGLMEKIYDTIKNKKKYNDKMFIKDFKTISY